MKFTLSWLKEHLETEASAEDIVLALTRIGLEVEGVENPAEKLAPFVVGHVLTAERHPQADKLQVLTVDAGTSEPLQVVCGAPNARAGMKGVFGPPGAYVPGSGITLKVAAIRGVESRGMMCSVRELELGDEHDGIIALPDDAPVGAQYAAYAGLDDPVIDVSVTPNRQDAMGVYGIARDLAAAGLGTLKQPELRDIAGSFPCPVEIRIEDAEGCPAFYGRVVRGVKNGASPAWLQQRLKAVGQRPISALVDITNYIMIGWGRPLHVYDLAKLTGAVTARRARDGEEVLALNGKSYRLAETMTVIADQAGVHDIGGTSGGSIRSSSTPDWRWRRRWRWSWPAARHRRSCGSVRRRGWSGRWTSGPSGCARLAASTSPRTSSATYCSGSASRWKPARPGASGCRAGAATSTAGPTSSRKSSGSTASTRWKRCPCPARRAWRGRRRPPSSCWSARCGARRRRAG
jgi:phenylalanyl-tRNA synthetase beta subunit